MKVKGPDSWSTAWTYDGVQTLLRLLKLRAGRDLLQVAVIFCGMALASGPAMSAGGNMDTETHKVLKAMSAYLSSLQKVSVQADVDIEVVMTDGQKLQLTSLVDVALERPGRLHVRRQGAYADAQILINGEKVTLHVTSHNAYAQLESAGSIDDGLDTLDRETGLDAPAADLFRSDPYDKLAMELTSGVYLGTTFVNGEECHYMAFRSDAADSQIWVRTGDRPLPMKYIVTSKWTTGSPQYSVRFRNWDTAPTLAANRYEFTPSPSDRRLETIPVNQVGEFSLKEAQR
jgi:hypothetical protein